MSKSVVKIDLSRKQVILLCDVINASLSFMENCDYLDLEFSPGYKDVKEVRDILDSSLAFSFK